MHCARMFDAPSHFLSTNRDVNLFLYVVFVQSLLMVMKHDQEGASLARVANSHNHPYANTTSLLPSKQCPNMRRKDVIY